MYYISRKTNSAERNLYSYLYNYELETMAVIRALEKFRISIKG